MAAARLTLYGRGYCHLCDDMRKALQPLIDEFGAQLLEVDVDSDVALEERYGELVPVLLGDDGELCHYFLDEASVRAYLLEIR